MLHFLPFKKDFEKRLKRYEENKARKLNKPEQIEYDTFNFKYQPNGQSILTTYEVALH